MAEPIYAFRDTPRQPSTRAYYAYRDQNTPIVIDNGAGCCRAGWAGENEPRLIFDSLVARPRFKKDDQPSLFLVGNDIDYIHLVRWALR
jgi:actin-related protein 5